MDYLKSMISEEGVKDYMGSITSMNTRYQGCVHDALRV